MAINLNKNKKNVNSEKQKPNVILIFTLIVTAIPICVLAFILLTSMNKKGEPIIEGRFDTQLNPAIEEKSLQSIEDQLQLEGVENVSVSLKAATVRITIDMVDTADQATITALIDPIYAIVNSVLPTETYFTNHDTTKMYDLEIHIYNIIPDPEVPEQVAQQAYAIIYKNAPAEAVSVEWPTNVKSQETYDALHAALEAAKAEQAAAEQAEAEKNE